MTGGARHWGDLGQEPTSPTRWGWDQSPALLLALCSAHPAAHVTLEPPPLPQEELWGHERWLLPPATCHPVYF